MRPRANNRTSTAASRVLLDKLPALVTVHLLEGDSIPRSHTTLNKLTFALDHASVQFDDQYVCDL